MIGAVSFALITPGNHLDNVRSKGDMQNMPKIGKLFDFISTSHVKSHFSYFARILFHLIAEPSYVRLGIIATIRKCLQKAQHENLCHKNACWICVEDYHVYKWQSKRDYCLQGSALKIIGEFCLFYGFPEKWLWTT